MVLEAETSGAASGRNGGMCNNGFAQDYGTLSAKLGRERRTCFTAPSMPAWTRSSASWPKRASTATSRASASSSSPPSRSIMTSWRERRNCSRARSIPTRGWCAAPSCAAEIGSDRYYGGLLYEKSAGMHMGMYGQGLAEAAARRGAMIHEHNPLIGLRRAAGQVHEVDHAARAGARQSGAAGDRHVGDRAAGLVPAADRAGGRLHHRHRAACRRAARSADAAAPQGSRHARTSSTISEPRPTTACCSVAARAFAVTDPGFRREERRRCCGDRCSRFSRSSRDTRIDYCWGGMVDMTRDRLPRAGERDGLFYSMGYSGHGTQMATYMGAIMAEVMDGRADLNPWRDFDWPAIPGHFGQPWFLPMVGAYYRFQDLVQ